MTFIKGELCELRVLERSDEEARQWCHYVNQGLTTKHLFTGSIPMRSIDVKKVWEHEAAQGSVEFGIYAKYDERGSLPTFIGTTGLYGHRDIYRSWEFRILIFHPDYLGKGIGTEATRLVVEYGFGRLNAHRIWLGVNADNKGAVACYKQAGFKPEGRLRDEIFCYGKYHDAIRMGILEGEFCAKGNG